ERYRIGSGHQRLFEQDIIKVAPRGAVPDEHAITIDEGKSGTHEIRKINQAFVDFLMQLITRFAPAFQHCRTISATIFGLVLAACSGVRSQPMFGFTKTMSVRETKRWMPPSSSRAVRASCSGSSPCMTAISGKAASDATVWLRLAFIASACSGRSLCLLSQNPRPAAPAATPPTRSNLISASRRL